METLDNLNFGGIPFDVGLVIKSISSDKYIGVDRIAGNKLFAKTDLLNLTQDNVFTLITAPLEPKYALILCKVGENLRIFTSSADATLTATTSPYDTNNTRFQAIMQGGNILSFSEKSYPNNWMRFDTIDGSIDVASTTIDDNSTFMWYLASTVMDNTSGIETQKDDPNALFIYPTIVESTFTISGNSKANIAIYSIDGNKVFESIIPSNTPVNVSNLSKGIYLVECRKGDKIQVLKMIKKNNPI